MACEDNYWVRIEVTTYAKRITMAGVTLSRPEMDDVINQHPEMVQQIPPPIEIDIVKCPKTCAYGPAIIHGLIAPESEFHRNFVVDGYPNPGSAGVTLTVTYGVRADLAVGQCQGKKKKEPKLFNKSSKKVKKKAVKKSKKR